MLADSVSMCPRRTALEGDPPMHRTSLFSYLITVALLALCRIAASAEDVSQPPRESADQVTITELDDRCRVLVGGELFTEYVYRAHEKPILYPILGPHGIGMTRNYPMQGDVPGEAHDHPHHKSMWYAHRPINGVDFWSTHPTAGKCVHDKLLKVTSGTGCGVIRAANNWVASDGKIIFTDTRTLTFQVIDGARSIDWEITIRASNGDLTFGDSKEGTMAIRTHPNLRLQNDPNRGVTTANGQTVNSEGVRGPAVWGKRADWIDYWGRIDGKTVGIAIFDHPSNPRHPTHWMARAYGYIGANPFGLNAFEGKPRGTGDMRIPAGTSVTFRYRFTFHEGDAEQAKIALRYPRGASRKAPQNTRRASPPAKWSAGVIRMTRFDLSPARWTPPALLLLLLGISGVPPAAGAEPRVPNDRITRITSSVALLLTERHLSQRPLDDEIAGRCLKRFLERMDPWKVYLLQSDVDRCLTEQNDLDEQVRQGNAGLAFTVFKTLLKRVDQRAGLVDELLTTEHDFTVDESFTTDTAGLAYPCDDAEARERWRKRVKHDLLVLKSYGIDQAEAVERLTKRYQRIAEQTRRMGDEQVLEVFLTALASAFDPHGAYLSADTMSHFNITIRLDLEGIGTSLASEHGGVVVRRIVPGGAADRDGRLEVGDTILGIGQGPDGPIEDVVGRELPEVVRLLRGKRGTPVRLEVVSACDRRRKIITLTRERIDSKATEAAGTVLEKSLPTDDRVVRIGWIDLPSFYMDMAAAVRKEPDFKRTSRDVRRILKDFNTRQVDAVLVDLRRNGGASLTEAIRLTGLFIDRGPVVQTRDAHGKIRSYDDSERGTAWDGPLVVLTGKSSASSAEVFAGAIRDYRRGLVVGDRATCGRGTVQSLWDVGRYAAPDDPSLRLGGLKLTTYQLYGPGGASWQHRGVPADIALPSAATRFVVGEADLDYALPFHQVEAADFKLLGKVNEPLCAWLNERSANRRRRSPYFEDLHAEISPNRQQSRCRKIPLNEKEFIRWQDARRCPAEPAGETDGSTGPRVRRNDYVEEVLAITVNYVCGRRKEMPDRSGSAPKQVGHDSIVPGETRGARFHRAWHVGNVPHSPCPVSPQLDNARLTVVRWRRAGSTQFSKKE